MLSDDWRRMRTHAASADGQLALDDNLHPVNDGQIKTLEKKRVSSLARTHWTLDHKII